MSRRVLVVDDDRKAAELLSEPLVEAGYEVRRARDGRRALEALDAAVYDLVVTDFRMPGLDGLGLLKQVRSSWPHLPVILVSVVNDAPTAVRSLQLGARNYLLKPCSDAVLLDAVHKALLSVEPRREVDAPKILGGSRAMQRLRDQVRLAARCDASVMLTGESGTGKELAARSIHHLSTLHRGPFVPVNCAAIPVELFESEMFGHERGAFTGAHTSHPGLIAEADAGVLFLDELEALRLEHQAKLLRVLQDGELRGVGSRRPRQVFVRVVSATNVDPARLLDDGALREDLFHRLRGFEIRLPPLVERLDDVGPLAEHFLGERDRILTSDGADRLRGLPWGADARWRGNVRLLGTLMARAADVASGVHVGPTEIDAALGLLRLEADPTAPVARGELTVEQAKRLQVVEALRLHEGRRGRAAETLGVHRTTLQRWIKDLVIRPSEYLD